jgi:hypothetical protein
MLTDISIYFQAGLFLNMCVCGTLFRDLEVTKKQRQPQQLRRSLSNASSSAAVTTSAGMPEVEELRSLLEKGDISILFSQQELNDCPRLSSSLVNLPTYITSEEVDLFYIHSQCYTGSDIQTKNW